ncbi:beta-propeller fold lactonase family protein [Auraticoccus sp. F435]|uniref:Beta-propeller fold lactonase family protein n=1 Tax=Auraticoccus cholistanensis TaxID=2656650 RepID=A0A6A9UZ31_9ACTN|nr:beta-propeller fold lactonase family protein [Auraticoccus cholistanensis]MVA77174.1 beta-propeller fold lactonase family protein [Auraticoccus cholistanensis]
MAESDDRASTTGPDDAPELPLGGVLYVGGYTTREGAQRLGVEAYRLDSAGPDGVGVSELPAVALHSPTYLVRHPSHPVLYAVGETEPTTVSALRIGADQTLELLNTVVADGSGGCHLAVDETGQYLVVAHYGSGGVSSFAITSDGRLSEQVDHWTFHGSGPDADRQDAPHAHQVVPHAGRLLVADLGTDRVHQLHLDPEGHLGLADDPVVLPAGSGPRHLVVTGDHLAVACELSCQLWLARRRGGEWVQVDLVPSTSAEVDEDSPCYPSALRLDGTRLVVGNRGPDTFAVFELDPEHDRLVPVAEVGTGGSWPRDLLLTASHLWVANERGDAVVAHRRPTDPDGSWVLDFEIPTAAPSTLLLAEPS